MVCTALGRLKQNCPKSEASLLHSEFQASLIYQVIMRLKKAEKEERGEEEGGRVEQGGRKSFQKLEDAT